MINYEFIKRLMLLGMLSCAGLQVKSQDTPLYFHAGFTGDYVQNFAGGIKKGNSNLGLIDLSATFNTGDAKLWKGGSLFLHGESTMGGHPSEEIIGDIQVASNIDGVSNYFLYEFWYTQSLGNITILTGMNNLNNFFYVSSYSGSYINSSFGISPGLSLNNPISIFPVTTLGGLIRYDKKSFSLLTGFYNLSHDLTKEHTFSFKNHLFPHGYFTLTEVQFRLNKDDMVMSEYKVGTWFKRCSDGDDHHTAECPGEYDYGVYALADHILFKGASGHKVTLFVQTGYSPNRSNVSSLYIATGLNFSGFLMRRRDDEIGIALASARINRFLDFNQEFVYWENETVIELTCKLPLHKNLILQPDIQYIIHPARTEGLSNALVGMVRAKINF